MLLNNNSTHFQIGVCVTHAKTLVEVIYQCVPPGKCRDDSEDLWRKPKRCECFIMTTCSWCMHFWTYLIYIPLHSEVFKLSLCFPVRLNPSFHSHGVKMCNSRGIYLSPAGCPTPQNLRTNIFAIWVIFGLRFLILVPFLYPKGLTGVFGSLF